VNRTGPQVRFLRNDSSRGHHYLALRLEGTAAATNRDAIGARVEVKLAAGARPLVRTLKAGEGFLSQSSKWMHFGLGRSTHVESVTVRWPGAPAEEFRGLDADRRLVLVQGRGTALAAPTVPAPPPLAASDLPRTRPARSSRSVLAGRMPLPALSFIDRAGKRGQLEPASAGPLLVTFWSSWCPTCRGELEELAERRADLEAAGLKVVALSLDDVDEDPATPDDARALLGSLAFPFAAGFVDASTLQRVRAYYNALFAKHPPLPIPTSFLVDGSGRLAVLYKGALEIDRALADVKLLAAPPERWFDLALPFAGRRYGDPPAVALPEFVGRLAMEAGAEEAGRYLIAAEGDPPGAVPAPRRRAWHDLHMKLAARLLGESRLESAAVHVSRALRYDPQSAQAHLRAGELMLSLKKDTARAEEYFQRALALDPRLTQAVESARRGAGR